MKKPQAILFALLIAFMMDVAATSQIDAICHRMGVRSIPLALSRT
jgi:hypothetical protein